METSRSQIVCPSCPLCSGPPSFNWAELTPWFCPNEECDVLAWDPYSTLQENLTDARPIEYVEGVPEE